MSLVRQTRDKIQGDNRLIYLNRGPDNCQVNGYPGALLLPSESSFPSAMTDLRTNSPLRDAFSPVQNCRTRYDDWATTLTQSEQEIDQLLNLLAELPDENYRSLRHHTIDYAQGLNQIKNRIHRLRIDVVCAGTSCAASTASASCSDTHFAPPATSNTLMSTVATEFNLIRERCQTFFGELMRLNLI